MGTRNTPLTSFDMFLDSLERMNNGIAELGIDSEKIPLPSHYQDFDKDIINLSDLEKFTISEESSIDSNDEDISDADSFDFEPGSSATDNMEVLSWLEVKCAEISNSSMSSTEMYSTILGILTSDASDDDLQMSLPDIIGYEHLDFLIELISKRQSIKIAQVIKLQANNL